MTLNVRNLGVFGRHDVGCRNCCEKEPGSCGLHSDFKVYQTLKERIPGADILLWDWKSRTEVCRYALQSRLGQFQRQGQHVEFLKWSGAPSTGTTLLIQLPMTIEKDNWMQGNVNKEGGINMILKQAQSMYPSSGLLGKPEM